MKVLGNILWLILGGFLIGLEYLVASILLIVTIIGIPFGLQTLKLASLAFWPFGREGITIEGSSGCISLLMNILWILLGGIWIAATHLVLALLFFITIIGFPFAIQHVKLATVALVPFGQEVRPIRRIR